MFICRLFELRRVTSDTDLYQAELHVTGDKDALTENNYSLLVTVRDDGKPPRESSVLLVVAFPPIDKPVTPVPTPDGSGNSDRPTSTVPVAAARTVVVEDNMLTIILGAVAGVLLVIILILVVYICWR